MGKVFSPFERRNFSQRARITFWEHEGNRAVRKGDWKLVALQKGDWELYNLSVDPFERNNLIEENQRKLNLFNQAMNRGHRSTVSALATGSVNASGRFYSYPERFISEGSKRWGLTIRRIAPVQYPADADRRVGRALPTMPESLNERSGSQRSIGSDVFLANS